MANRTTTADDRARPGWLQLMQLARERAGFFTASEAVERGISPQLLRDRVERGVVDRELRGVYRFASAAPTDHDEFVTLWLWSNQEATFSHVTALLLHGLSDALPSKVHMTVPSSWRYARFTKPPRTVFHVDDLGPDDSQWLGLVRVTTVARTLADCIATDVSRSLIDQGLAQARRRKLITVAEHARLRRTQKRAES